VIAIACGVQALGSSGRLTIPFRRTTRVVELGARHEFEGLTELLTED
jgi:hypothetical protein